MIQSGHWKQQVILFLMGQTLSLFGSSIVGYAVIWYVTLETSSGSVMTWLILATFLPQLLISLFAGVWADRYNRKAMIMLGDLFTASVTLVLALSMLVGNESLPALLILTALRSVGSGIQSPAVSAALPQLVPTEHLTRVNGINSTLNSVTMLMSPALGGMLFGSIGLARTLFLDVITAGLAVIMMLFLSMPTVRNDAPRVSVFRDILDGCRYTGKNTVLWRLLVYYGLFFILVAPAAFLTPIMVERSYGGDVWRLTLNETLWVLGELLGGVIIALWGGFRNRLHSMSLATFCFGIGFALMGAVTSFWVYLIIIGLTGIFMPIFSTAETVLIQETVEESMLGRVFSIVNIIVSATMPLGMLLFGPLSDMVRIEGIMIVTGILITLLAPGILRISRFLPKAGEAEL